MKEAWVAVSAAADGCTMFQAPRMLSLLRQSSSVSQALAAVINPFYEPDRLIDGLWDTQYEAHAVSSTYPLLSMLEVLKAMPQSYKKW